MTQIERTVLYELDVLTGKLRHPVECDVFLADSVDPRPREDWGELWADWRHDGYRGSLQLGSHIYRKV